MTGSGKTLAFLLPLLGKIAATSSATTSSSSAAKQSAAGKSKRKPSPPASFAAAVTSKPKACQVLIVVPTRELAVQIAREAVLLSGGHTSSVELVVDSQVKQCALIIRYGACIPSVCTAAFFSSRA